MISREELIRAARDSDIIPELLERDYALGWALFGISLSSQSQKLAFKGGTALSKVYYPEKWRLSEDLDFTFVSEDDSSEVCKTLHDEVPAALSDRTKLSFRFKGKPLIRKDYIQMKLECVGPISSHGNTIKLEALREQFLGVVRSVDVPRVYPDYPNFSVLTYSIENILAEKMRSLLERKKVRDYYDVWRLTKSQDIDYKAAKSMFLKKCEGRDVNFRSVDDFFPPDLLEVLKPYIETGLTRLVREPTPGLNVMIDETRSALEARLR